EAAIKQGERRFEPGVLAEANRNILYVDEVNLLDDHLVDVLLDAAAMGVNVVEREGISVWHPSRFILVGTMNPEEGDLRPQLLDRFGLCVDIRGLRTVAERVQVMEREARLRDGVDQLVDASAQAEERQGAVIEKASELLPLVEVPATIRQFVSLICLDAGAMGHRADIIVSRAARTICATREADLAVTHDLGDTERLRPADALCVRPADVVRAAELALPHRRRDRHERGDPRGQGIAEQARERLRQMEAPVQEGDTEAATTSAPEGAPAGQGGDRGEGSTSMSPERAEAREQAPGQPDV